MRVQQLIQAALVILALAFALNAAAQNYAIDWFKAAGGGVHNDGDVQPGARGTELMHLVSSGLYVNGVIVLTSDRNAKENFAPVDPKTVLEKVVALPITK